MHIFIRPDAAAVAVAAADVLAPYVKAGATLGLATGSTPVPTYQELIRRHKEEGLSFADCSAFLLDEYVGLPREHEESYYRTIRREFTEHIDIDDARVNSPDGTAADPIQAGELYDAAIVQAGGIAVQLLGIGANGHIGFNEPGSSLASLSRPIVLHPQTIADNARFFDSEDEVPIMALSQGLGTIQRAGHLLLIATGENKAEAIAGALEGPVSASCPGSAIQMHPHVTVIVDEAAASKLAHADYYRRVEELRPQWLGY